MADYYDLRADTDGGLASHDLGLYLRADGIALPDARVRFHIAKWLISLLAAGLALAFGGWLIGKDADEVAKIASVLLAPITGLMGTVLGFYFARGEQSG